MLRKICTVVENTGSTAEQVAEALKLDPATAGKVLCLANSADIGSVPRKISSVQNAVMLLGIPRVRSLVVVTQRINPVIKTVPPFSLERHWRHSIAVALIAESIARHYQRYGAIDEQEAFSAGLLHDIGKLVLAVYKAERLARAWELSVKEKLPFYKTEEGEWLHSAIGKLLAAHWNFPTELSDAVSGHHGPVPQAGHALIIAMVHVADVMVHTVGLSTFPDEAVPQVDGNALEMMRLPAERLRIIAETEMEHQKKIEDELLQIL